MSVVNNDENLNKLKVMMGEQEAVEVLQLLEKYNKYVGRFKKKINSILMDKGYQIKTGIQFSAIEQSKGELNGSDKQTTNVT